MAGLALSAGTAQAASGAVHHEREAAGRAGGNDRRAQAERVPALGTGEHGRSEVRILGRVAKRGVGGPVASLPPAAEDDGSIPLATPTGLRAAGTVRTTGTLGDGPHGPSGDGTNDFDFSTVEVPAGHQLVVDTSGSDPSAAVGVVVYDARGRQVAAGTGGGSTPGTTRLVVTPRSPGRHHVMLAGNGAFPQPADPFDSGSGFGNAATGDYALSLSLRRADRDQYAVKLRPGDVLGASVSGSANAVRISDPSGRERMGTTGVDASPLYPKRSPLPGGGNAAIAFVAARGGWYTVGVDGDPGRYDLRLGAHRPGAEGDGRQTVLVDFGGGRFDTRPLRGDGVRTLSPFSAFLGRWGLSPSREAALTRKITGEVRAALVDEVEQKGRPLDVRVVSSRTHPHLRGRRNVTRVLVGGTVAETGLDTIGTSEGVDPGNFAHEQVALVLLDRLSDSADRAFSLNHYLGAASDREAFIARAVGNVAAHEVAHTLGSFHTDNTRIDELMDSAGRTGFAAIFGVGPDGIGGTSDDVNLRLGTDRYAQAEGFTGVEDTRATTRWAFLRRR